MNQLLYRHAYVLAILCCFFGCSAHSDPLFFSEPETGANNVIEVRFSIGDLGQPEWDDSLKFCQKGKRQVVFPDGLDERAHKVTGEYDLARRRLIIKHATRGRLDDRCEFTVSLGGIKSTSKRIDFLNPYIKEYIHIEKPDDSDDDKKRHTITETIVFTNIELPETSCEESAPLLVIEFISSPVLDDKAIDTISHGNELSEAGPVTKKSSETYQDFCRLGKVESKEGVDGIVVFVPSQVAFLEKKISRINPVYIKVSEFEGFEDTAWNDVIFKVYAEGESLFFRPLYSTSPDDSVSMAEDSKPFVEEFLYSSFFGSEDASAKMKATSGQWEFNFEGKESERNKDVHMYLEFSRLTVENGRVLHEPWVPCEGPAVLFSLDAGENMENDSAIVKGETIKPEPNGLNIKRVVLPLRIAAYFMKRTIAYSTSLGATVKGSAGAAVGGIAGFTVGTVAGGVCIGVAQGINCFRAEDNKLDTRLIGTVVATGVSLGGATVCGTMGAISGGIIGVGFGVVFSAPASLAGTVVGIYDAVRNDLGRTERWSIIR